MNQSKAWLYDAFGQIIYAVAIADGEVQDEEIDKLHETIENHPWAREIVWSFNYETTRNRPIHTTLQKAMAVFEQYGPCEEYEFFIDLVERVADAFDGIVPQEEEILELLREELLEGLNGKQII